MSSAPAAASAIYCHTPTYLPSFLLPLSDTHQPISLSELSLSLSLYAEARSHCEQASGMQYAVLSSATVFPDPSAASIHPIHFRHFSRRRAAFGDVAGRTRGIIIVT